MGVARDDGAARWNAQLRNFEFFGGPVAGFVCMHHDLGRVDAPRNDIDANVVYSD